MDELKDPTDLQRVYDLFYGEKPKTILSAVQFVREGPLTITKLPREKKPDDYFVVLINDTMFLCREKDKKNEKYKIAVSVRMRDSITVEEKLDECFDIKIEKTTLACKAPDNETRERWAQSIRDVVLGRYSVDPAVPVVFKTDESGNKVWDPTGGLDERRREVFDKFKKMVVTDRELDDWEEEWLDDGCLCRFLRARSFNLEKSREMIMNTIAWRREYQPHAIDVKDIELESKCGKMYVNPVGLDKQGRPCVYMRPRLDNTKDRATKVKYMVWILEYAAKLMNTSITGVEKMNWMIDFKDSKISPADFSNTKISLEILHILQDNYPERLGQAFIVNPPGLFAAFWKMISPFVDPVTARKIVFCKKEADLVKLINYYEKDQLEEEYGGTLKYEYDHKSWCKEHGLTASEEVERKDKKKKKPKKESSSSDKAKKESNSSEIKEE